MNNGCLFYYLWHNFCIYPPYNNKNKQNMANKDESLFSKVKNDITEHLGKGKLYEVVVKDYRDDAENGKIYFVIEDNKEWFQVNSYDSYCTNSPHYFDIPERGKSVAVDVIRDIFGEDAAIMGQRFLFP